MTFICETCGATYQSIVALKKHKSWNHEDNEKDRCKYCGVVVQNMKLHVDNTHENLIENCKQCDFQTRRKDSMQKHTKTNLETCEFCGVLSIDLSRHLERTNCGQGKCIDERKSEPYNECGKLFTTKKSLDKHMYT